MFTALHECGHVSMWRTESTAPKQGHLITCARCGRGTRVVELFGPWRAKCRDCRLDGHATLHRTALEAAIKHAQHFTTHRVWVWQYGDTDSAVLVTKDNAGVQPAMFSDAPF